MLFPCGGLYVDVFGGLGILFALCACVGVLYDIVGLVYTSVVVLLTYFTLMVHGLY